MTRATLREQIAADITDLFLDADNRDEGFSEPVTYVPADDADDGVERTIEVVIEGGQTPVFDEIGNESQEEQIRVFVERHATRGITEPLVGAQLIRSATYESDTRPYYFAGEQPGPAAPERTTNAWILLFARQAETGRGVRQ